MKTEREIRELRDSVLFLLEHLPLLVRFNLPIPPDAPKTFDDVAIALSWVLGECEVAQADLDSVNEIVAKLRHEMRK
jgi:hypothetical protein